MVLKFFWVTINLKNLTGTQNIYFCLHICSSSLADLSWVWLGPVGLWLLVGIMSTPHDIILELRLKEQLLSEAYSFQGVS